MNHLPTQRQSCRTDIDYSGIGGTHQAKGTVDMPINEALLAAMKAAGYIKPNARKTYKIQRA
ncbi:hypothetical protein BBAG_1157 [Bifidobacterium angulatum DSM 20098 = JCM 7096]|nr:hypothetical protein BBAG_1157 [Bifidobacterium angulatum DSM 20098 = JCM 7096]